MKLVFLIILIVVCHSLSLPVSNCLWSIMWPLLYDFPKFYSIHFYFLYCIPLFFCIFLMDSWTLHDSYIFLQIFLLSKISHTHSLLSFDVKPTFLSCASTSLLLYSFPHLCTITILKDFYSFSFLHTAFMVIYPL